MPLQEIQMPFPDIRDNGDGTVSLRMGKIEWKEGDEEPLLGVESIERSIQLYAKMWCIKNGIQTWRELFSMPNALQAFRNHTATIRVRE